MNKQQIATIVTDAFNGGEPITRGMAREYYRRTAMNYRGVECNNGHDRCAIDWDAPCADDVIKYFAAGDYPDYPKAKPITVTPPKPSPTNGPTQLVPGKHDDHPRTKRAMEILDELTYKFETKALKLKVNTRFDGLGGRAWYYEGLIEIGGWVVEDVSDFDFEDTVRHEFAHILNASRDYSNSSHGPEWQQAAIESGATPTRCMSMESVRAKQAKYVMACGEGCEWRKNRMSDFVRYPGTRTCRTHKLPVQRIK